MSRFKEWLRQEENHGVMPLYKLNLLLDELNTHDGVGITGSGGFTITYTLVANVSLMKKFMLSMCHI